MLDVSALPRLPCGPLGNRTERDRQTDITNDKQKDHKSHVKRQMKEDKGDGLKTVYSPCMYYYHISITHPMDDELPAKMRQKAKILLLLWKQEPHQQMKASKQATTSNTLYMYYLMQSNDLNGAHGSLQLLENAATTQPNGEDLALHNTVLAGCGAMMMPIHLLLLPKCELEPSHLAGISSLHSATEQHYRTFPHSMHQNRKIQICRLHPVMHTNHTFIHTCTYTRLSMVRERERERGGGERERERERERETERDRDRERQRHEEQRCCMVYMRTCLPEVDNGLQFFPFFLTGLTLTASCDHTHQPTHTQQHSLHAAL